MSILCRDLRWIVTSNNEDTFWFRLAVFCKEHGLKDENDVKTAPRIVKEKLAAAKAAWSEAARSNPDALNIDEFLSFTHPESSHSLLATETEELFGRHDADENGVISLQEYLEDPFIEFDKEEIEERRRRLDGGSS